MKAFWTGGSENLSLRDEHSRLVSLDDAGPWHGQWKRKRGFIFPLQDIPNFILHCTTFERLNQSESIGMISQNILPY